MIRLAVSVEGQTEEAFINAMFVPHLQSFGVVAHPVLLGHARNRRASGGNVTMESLVAEIVHLMRSFDAVTTLVDFYGFSGKEENSADDLEHLIRDKVEEKIGWQGSRLVPYIQRHEFESLLFSDVDGFLIVPSITTLSLRRLHDIRSEFNSPEDINDSTSTAPARRIAGAFPRYHKRFHGPLIAEKIGIDKIRSECPRFNLWLERLERLGDNIGEH